MTNSIEDHVSNALKFVWKLPEAESHQINPGNRQDFYRSVVRIAEIIDLNPDKHKISHNGVIELIRDVILEVAESYDEDEDDLHQVFQTEKSKIFSETLGEPAKNFDIIFPMSCSPEVARDSVPDRLDLGFSILKQITYEQWNDQYIDHALESESSNLEAFLAENPNEPNKFDWSYWKIQSPARDDIYAIQQVKDALQALFAEINFARHRWTTGMPRRSSRRAPRDRWSYLQLPFVFLAFLNGHFEKYRAMDYDPRGSFDPSSFKQKIDSLEDLPKFYRRLNKLNKIEHVLHNALISYQEGITEPKVRRSFLDFWRGIEHLAGVERITNNEEVVQRANFALHHVIDIEDGLSRETEEAIDELAQTRNELAHEWPDAHISILHRNAAKILLDGLVTFFLETKDQLTIKEVNNLMKYGSMYHSGEQVEEILKALETLGIARRQVKKEQQKSGDGDKK